MKHICLFVTNQLHKYYFEIFSNKIKNFNLHKFSAEKKKRDQQNSVPAFEI